MPREMRVDRSAVSVVSLFDEPDERYYWWNRTPDERLAAVEALRRMNYGDDATARLQRVFEIAQRGGR
jgi:hypothetical protein